MTIAASTGLVAQNNCKEDTTAFQDKLNLDYKSPEESPLDKKQRRKFKGHDFFPFDQNFCITASFEKTKNVVPFQMKTTTNRLPTYEIYGVATFEINGQKYKLNIYQSHRLRKMEKYKNNLFLPFTDLTSGESSYIGGRFIDLTIPKGDTIEINFNKAYNPYCAYSYRYSCPIPPVENHLKVAIKAGVRFKTKK